MRSPKELSVDIKIIETLDELGVSGKIMDVVKSVLVDEEIQAIQEYANTVSIVSLGFNDHGPVHMHCVALNAVIMLSLLRQAGVKTSLEKEGVGDFEDSLLGVILGAMLHDLGMSVSRHDHEFHSAILAMPILDRLLLPVYSDSIKKRVMIRSLALEGIFGHMGSRSIHSLEAGVVQVADGSDMTKGRARIPLVLSPDPKMGSIHQFSANSIEEVRLLKGQEKAIRIEVSMSSELGLFQVEEVLMNKIAASTAKPHIELYAQVEGGELKSYL